MFDLLGLALVIEAEILFAPYGKKIETESTPERPNKISKGNLMRASITTR